MVTVDASSPELPRVIVDDIARIGDATVAAMPCHARRRGVVLALHGRGPASPWCPDRTSVDALVDALVTAGVPTRWTALGRAPAPGSALRRLSACSSDPRTIAVDWAPCSRPVVMPRAWLGRHLVLVVPTVLDHGAPSDDRRGPLASALVAMVASLGAGAVADELALATDMLASAFAGFTLVVDARHVLLRPLRPGRRPQRLAIGRTLLASRTGASASECRALVGLVDGWLAARVGARGEAIESLALVGPRASAPWPAGAAEPFGVDGPLWPSEPRARDEGPA